jgi:hypothetical protein
VEKEETRMEIEEGTKPRKEEEMARKEGRKEERKKRRLSSRGNSRDSTPVKRSKLSSLGSSSSPGETSTFYIYFIFLKKCINFKDLFEQLLPFFKNQRYPELR